MGTKTRQIDLAEAVEGYLAPGSTLAIGGLHFHNTPMALVREVIRQEVEIGCLVPPVDGSINADQLIGAGLVRELFCPYVGFEAFGMAGRFRAAAESGRLAVRECDEMGYVHGLLAGAAGLPYAPLPAEMFPDGDRPPSVPQVNPTDYRRVVDPFTGTEHVATRAVRPDLAFLHCQVVDRRGNGGYLGSAFLDVEMAKAADRCVVLAERVVDELPAECRSYLPGFLVDAVVELELGAHPASSHGVYRYDAEQIAAYAEASRTDAGFDRYRKELIGSDEDSYRRAVGIDDRRGELVEGP